MIVSVVSCTKEPDTNNENDGGGKNSINFGEDADDTVPNEESEESTSEEDLTKPFVPTYHGVFQTGYARASITPSKEELPIGDFTKIGNDIYITCVAVYDGDKTLMLISLEIEALGKDYCDEIREAVNLATGVPVRNIFVSAVHNHSAPNFRALRQHILDGAADASKDAMDDLTDTQVFIGTGKTTGMAFVRRYVDANGNYASVRPNNPDGASLDSTTTRCVSEADDTVQVIRFKREGSKDIIMTNWQAHLAHAIDSNPGVVSSDMLHYMRYQIESRDDDVQLAYFAGASANINLNAPNTSERKYRDYMDVAAAFAKVVNNVIKDENLTQVDAGKIKIKTENYFARHAKDSEEEIAAARKRLENGEGNVLKQAADTYLIARNRKTQTNLTVSAICFGDIAFITAPYEMFDNNGAQIKERSPFKMTFILTNADGAYAYMPSYEACTIYGGYETEATYFATGVAEKLVNKYVNMLERLK